MKNAILWDVTPCGSSTDVWEEPSASIIKLIRIGEQGTLAVTNNRRALRGNTFFGC
jgi:hypothetical protein